MTLPFSLHWVWDEKPKVFVTGIPVYSRVMKPRFQNMESWFDIYSLFTILEWIMVFRRWLVWAFCKSCMHAHEDTVLLIRYSVLTIWFQISLDVTPSKIIDELLGMDSCHFRIRHKLTCDMWAIDELHGTFTFRNSYSIPPQYMGDTVDRRILIWCT